MVFFLQFLTYAKVIYSQKIRIWRKKKKAPNWPAGVLAGWLVGQLAGWLACWGGGCVGGMAAAQVAGWLAGVPAGFQDHWMHLQVR